ncbi:MAG: 50S ribosomal protein L22 [Planctomycetota bacterium]
MAYVAKHRFAGISTRKARLVLELVRGRRLEDAIHLCAHSPKRAAVLVGKVLKSAQANARERGEEAVSALVITKAYADEGPSRRKWSPRARGGASPILKRTSHIVIELDTAAEGVPGQEA